MKPKNVVTRFKQSRVAQLADKGKEDDAFLKSPNIGVKPLGMKTMKRKRG